LIETTNGQRAKLMLFEGIFLMGHCSILTIKMGGII